MAGWARGKEDGRGRVWSSVVALLLPWRGRFFFFVCEGEEESLSVVRERRRAMSGAWPPWCASHLLLSVGCWGSLVRGWVGVWVFSFCVLGVLVVGD